MHKRKIDLLVLRYIAQQLHLTLQTMEQSLTDNPPFLYTATGRHSCSHRIVLYNPSQLLQSKSLAFVGFVSGRRAGTDSSVSQELHAVDSQMLAELARIPGLLAYSSLELRPGHWYNLVVMQSLESKAHFRQIGTHQYAAYELAPRAYDWIRIHSGIMPDGLTGNAMNILKTKHYVYLPTDNMVSTCEVVEVIY